MGCEAVSLEEWFKKPDISNDFDAFISMSRVVHEECSAVEEQVP